MFNMPESALTTQVTELVKKTLHRHEPLKISIGRGQSVVMLPEQDYRYLVGNQIDPLTQKTTQKKQRVFGSAKGMIKMADDFDAPLDDFKAYNCDAVVT